MPVTPITDYPYDVESDVYKNWLNELAKSVRNIIVDHNDLVDNDTWAFYRDQGHDQSDPQILVADVAQKVYNDGALGDQDHARGHNLYNTTTQIFEADSGGHLHIIELDFWAEGGNPALQYTIEGRLADSGIPLSSHIVPFTKGGNNLHRVSQISMIPFTQQVIDAGGIEIWITCDSNVDIYGVDYVIAHISGGWNNTLE